MAPDASDALAVRQKVQQFLTAARTGNLDLLKTAQLDDGKGMAKTVADIKDANKQGALHFAAREGQTEVCKFLVEDLKLDVDMKDEDDCETPLLHAARQGHTVTAKYLIEHGADPSIPSDLGATALHHSAGIGNIELLSYLRSKGVEVDSGSDAGTPLIWAAGHAQPDALKVLLEHHANAAFALFVVLSMLISVIMIKVQAGADVNVIAGGATPLHIAADNGKMRNLREVIAAEGSAVPTNALPEVSPEAKRRAAEAKSRGDDAFIRKDYCMAVDAYTQQALTDAKACRALRPDWSKACYREGEALRVLQRFSEAANSFYQGVKLDHDNKELVSAFREAVEDGRRFYGTDQERS
ncbi:hypothetical protein P3X46_005415 [Hevea brasiliensis]|uniref:Uncharacterized protein n=1 Tax=Hevea brasiliensis TaxID=3981 RepID=A0ABQ9N3C5_HEVBR|nr:hypothetical protein P3X46_005415 [Hevea brasiliensis]